MNWTDFWRPAVIGVCGMLLPYGPIAMAQWPQWGGPERNFTLPAGNGLKTIWPDGGPKQLWRRPLGFGHSSIVVDGDKLYTMYRKGDQEAVVALSAQDGSPLWEYAYDAPFLPGMNMDVGPGPHATPLIAGPFLYTIGVTGNLHCLDRASGKKVWSRAVVKEFEGTVMARGYSSSPLAYKDTVIVTVGGAGHAVVAFRQGDGAVAWQAQDFGNSHASPILINFAGRDQLAVLMDKIVAGLDPNNGELLWSHPNDTIGDHTTVTPLWIDDDDLLFVSAAYNGGSQVIRLVQEDGKTRAEQVWAHKQFRIHHTNAVRIGGHIFGTSGDFGPAFLAAVDIHTGEVLWRDRSFGKSNLLRVGPDQVLLLDEKGTLARVALTAEGVEVLGKASILEEIAWTPPTLVGDKLYVRDRKTIAAFELK